jgi:FixJ family two-component response regulator
LSGRIQISIIEDDQSVREALTGLMRSLGYEPSGFDSAETFLESPALHTADCIITDIQLTGMNGLDLKATLDTHELAVPVIMITARREADLHRRAIASGAFCFLVKPFDMQLLVDCVQRALAR